MSSEIILPSGESNYFDPAQYHANNSGSGINAVFPSPSDFSDVSGMIKTFPSDAVTSESSGIFSFYFLESRFSSAKALTPDEFFDGLGEYIHYFPVDEDKSKNGSPFEIPYLSTYKATSPYNPYGRL